jgi:malic enzyme
LFPSVLRLRAVSFEIAVAVARQATADGVAAVPLADVERLVREARWSHDYPDYLPA